MLKHTFLLLIICAFHSCQLKELKKENTTPPNIVFFLVDDLGWADLSSYGSSFYETPNIDKLATQGMLFTNAYAAAAICSPTRASILTGKHPARLNITDWIPGSDPKDRLLLGTDDLHALPLEEETLAEIFKKANYKTGFLGKWHLGGVNYLPENQGFDVNVGGHYAGQPASYFYPYKNENKNWDVPNLENGEEGEYLTDRLTEEALNFITTNKENPFLLYFSYYTVHTPIQGKSAYVKKYEEKLMPHTSEVSSSFTQEGDARTKLVQDNPIYASMVQSLDESVGRVLEELGKLNLTNKTIIVFTSDNGGLTTLLGNSTAPTSVLPLRAGKGWLYEGGIRVPLIIKYPKHIPPNTTCDIPVNSPDLYPTLAELAKLSSPPKQHMDGRSLIPLLKQSKDAKTAPLFWHFPHYHGSGALPSSAIRLDHYKLLEFHEDQRVELYNLKTDVGERNNLADTFPNIASNLLERLHNWQRNIGAKKAIKNPDFRVE